LNRGVDEPDTGREPDEGHAEPEKRAKNRVGAKQGYLCPLMNAIKTGRERKWPNGQADPQDGSEMMKRCVGHLKIFEPTRAGLRPIRATKREMPAMRRSIG